MTLSLIRRQSECKKRANILEKGEKNEKENEKEKMDGWIYSQPASQSSRMASSAL
jgi:hypothetical protein